MKLVMTLLVKDEVDIICANIDFHLAAGVDHIIVTDNDSTDGTREILSRYESSRDITVIDEPGDDYSQSRWVTRMALMAREEFRADWIINNDADEFWRHPEASVREVLSEATASVLICERKNMLTALDDLDAGPWPETLIYRVVEPEPMPRLANPLTDPMKMPYFLHRVLPKALVRADGLIHVAQGNHAAVYETEVASSASDVQVFHYPIRSTSQFESKIRSGGSAYERNTELPVEVGWHWRRLYKKLNDEGLVAAMADAVPDRAQLAMALQTGRVIEDRSMTAQLQAASRLAPGRR